MAKHTALLGKQARSVISGFEGIITARADYLTGCVQYCLKPPIDKDGKDQDGRWFDVDAIEVIGEGVRSQFPLVTGELDEQPEPQQGTAVGVPGGPQQDQPPT